MHLNCPHCRNPIEVVEPAAGEVLCPSCGSSFRVADNTTTTLYRPVVHGQMFGRFVVQDQVGMGAFGTVYRAIDGDLHRTVAVKVPRAGNIDASAEGLDRFLREARSAAQLRHPAIVTMHEVGMHHDQPYLVSDYVDGVTLADWLTAHQPTFRQAARWIADLADALHYAHSQGIVHRDVKPSNIMLASSTPLGRRAGGGVASSTLSPPGRRAGDEATSSPLSPPGRGAGGEATSSPLSPSGRGAGGEGLSQGEAHRLFLMDFGLAKRDAGEITMTLEGQILGTPAYMSPEQAKGLGHAVDGRADEYSLGVILYELLTGELPFRGNARMLLHQVLHDEPKPLRKINDRIPHDLETICLKAMAREPSRRYADCAALRDELLRYLEGEPIQARPVGLAEKTMKWVRRRPLVAGLLGVILVTALSAFTIILFLLIDSERNRKDAELAGKQASEQKTIAETQRESARKARDESQALLARQYNLNAQRAIEADDLSTALLWTSESLLHGKANPDLEEHNRILFASLLSHLPQRLRLPMASPASGYQVSGLVPEKSRLFQQGVNFIGVAPDHDLLMLHYINLDTGKVVRPSLSLPKKENGLSLRVWLDLKNDQFLLEHHDRQQTTRKIQVWDLITGLPRQAAWNCDLDTRWISPDGSILCAFPHEKVCAFYQTSDGKLLSKLDLGKGYVQQLAWGMGEPSAVIVVGEYSTTDQVGDQGPRAVLLDLVTGRQLAVKTALRPTVHTRPGGKAWLVGMEQAGDAFTPFLQELRSGKKHAFPQIVCAEHESNHALSADAKVLAISDKNMLHLLDVESGQPLLPPQTLEVNILESLAFAPAGNRLLAMAQHKSELWQIHPPARIRTIPHGVRSSPDTEVFNARGDSFWMPDSDNRLLIFNAANGLPMTAQVFQANVSQGHISHNGRYIDGTDLWDLMPASRPVSQSQLPGPANLLSLVRNLAHRCIIGTGDHHAWIWDQSGRNITHRLPHPNVNQAVLSHDGKRLLTASWHVIDNYRADSEAKIILWDLEAAKPLATLFDVVKGSVVSVVFSPDDRWAIACLNETMQADSRLPEARLAVFDCQTGKLVKEMKSWKHIDSNPTFFPELRFCFFPGMPDLFCIYHAGIARFSLPSLELSGRTQFGCGGWGFLPTSANSILTWFDGACSHVEITDGSMKLNWDKGGMFSRAALHQKSRRIALARRALQDMSEIRVVDASFGEPLSMAMLQREPVNLMTFSHHGRWLATSGSTNPAGNPVENECTIRVWDIQTGTLLLVPARLKTALILDLSFSADDAELQAMAADGQIHHLPLRQAQGTVENLSRQAVWQTQMRVDRLGTVVAARSAPFEAAHPIKPNEPQPSERNIDPVSLNQWHYDAADRADSLHDLQSLREHLQAFQPRPDSFADYLWMGWKYIVLGELDASRKAFDQATRIAPQDSRAWVERGLNHAFHRLKNKTEEKDLELIQKELTAGLQDILHGLMLNPDHHTSDLEIMLVLNLAVHTPQMPAPVRQAALKIAEILCRSDQFHFWHNALAWARYRNGKWQEALQALDEFENKNEEALQPSHADILLLLGNPWSTPVVAHRSLRPRHHALRAMIYFNLKQHERARSCLDMARYALIGKPPETREPDERLLKEATALISPR